MAHVLTISNAGGYTVGSGKDTPVLLHGESGKDYVLVRVKTTGTNCKLRLLVKFEADDLTEVDVAASNGVVNGIIPDTPFNRAQLSHHNTGGTITDWTYALVFADATWIDVIVPINNIIVSAVVAASMAITPVTALESAGSGLVGVQASSGVAIGKPWFFINSSGTGTDVVPIVLYGMMTNTVKA